MDKALTAVSLSHIVRPGNWFDTTATRGAKGHRCNTWVYVFDSGSYSCMHGHVMSASEVAASYVDPEADAAAHNAAVPMAGSRGSVAR